jgi:hypothetical protein
LVRNGFQIYEKGFVTTATLDILKDYTQTETGLADAVSKAHVAATEGSGITITGQQIAATLGTDIAYSEIEAASLVIESEGIASNDNDTTIPTSAAVKDYCDTNDANTTYTAGTGITLNDTTFSADVGIYRQVLSASVSGDTVLYLLNGARVTYYDLILSGDCQADTTLFNGAVTPQDGDSLIIRVTASGDARTLAMLEGGDNTFAYGSTITGADITATESGKTDYIGCTFNDAKKRWLVISYSKGY